MKLIIYNFIILILIPFFTLRIILKSFFDPGYKDNISQRLGYKLQPIKKNKKKVIWLHAVSLGEVIGSEGIINTLKKYFEIVITTSTPTGYRRAKELFDNKVCVNYAPWDFFGFLDRFIYFYKPSAILIFETEIWPSMISKASRKSIPLYLLNGRLSQKSYKTYSMFSWFMKDILRQITFCFVQTDKHLDRFLNLGIRGDKIKSVGSVKFDLPGVYIQEIDSPSFILGASTHEGEEKILLSAFRSFSRKKDFKLYICPRHPERAEKILNLSNANGFETVLFSKLESKSFEVCIIDMIGLLPSFYASSKMAFVGGSLVQRGGHNLIEPAALGSPVIIGPHFFNFEDIANEFIENNACIKVTNEDELISAMELLSSDAEAASNLKIRAKEIVDKNRGSTKIQASYIISELGEKS